MTDLEIIELAETTSSNNNANKPPENLPAENSCDALPSNIWTYRHVITTIIASLGMLSIGGATQGFAATALKDVHSQSNFFNLSNDDMLLLLVLNNVSAILSSFASCWLLDIYGRKLCMMLGGVFITVGLVIVSASSHIYLLHFGEFVIGFGAGFAQASILVYIIEIAPISIRGGLIALYQVSYNVGILLSIVVGVFFSWRWQVIVSATISTVYVCVLVILPDSPRWLLMVGLREKCHQSIKWFYKDDSDVIPFVLQDDECYTTPKPIASWKSLAQCPLLKLILISQVLFIIREFIGMSIKEKFVSYAFKETHSTLTPVIQSASFLLASLLGSIFCVFVVDRVTRRRLIFATFVIMSISMAGAAIYFQLKHLNYTSTTVVITWIPILCLVIAVFAYNTGIGTLAYVISAELFETPNRGKAISLAILGLNVLMCSTDLILAKLLIFSDDSMPFWISLGIGLMGKLFVYFFVPETKFNSTN